MAQIVKMEKWWQYKRRIKYTRLIYKEREKERGKLKTKGEEGGGWWEIGDKWRVSGRRWKQDVSRRSPSPIFRDGRSRKQPSGRRPGRGKRRGWTVPNRKRRSHDAAPTRDRERGLHHQCTGHPGGPLGHECSPIRRSILCVSTGNCN